MKHKSNGELKIEHGVPIPTHGRTGNLRDTLTKMVPGDSLLIPSKSAYAYAMVRAAWGQGNYTCRKEENGIRVWRTA